MNKYLTKILISIMFTFVAAAVFLTACGGKPASTPSPSPSPVTPPPVVATAPKADSAALKAKGEEIYQKTAGGIGCKTCHGADGKGIPNTAADVRGASADDIKRALGGDAMSFISLTEDDIQAVAAYLKYLESLPN